MNVRRFSLRTLLAAVAYLAIVLTAVGTGSLGWANFVFNLTIGILLVATLVAVFSANTPRTFLQGFCLIAWIYMFLAPSRYDENTRSEHPLITQQVLSVAYERLLAPMYEKRGLIFPIQTSDPFQAPPWRAFVQTGHCLWTFALGIAGGCLAVFFQNRSENQPRAK